MVYYWQIILFVGYNIIILSQFLFLSFLRDDLVIFYIRVINFLWMIYCVYVQVSSFLCSTSPFFLDFH